MRNLKRALSLALASIMLLGMMVTGASAASNSFTDFDQIVNQEAAEVTSGLGIFDGYTDGSFGPENVVTRAEMAVIICKLLNGSDVDPGNFTDIDTFDDVPAWAEGYVNYCASMGIVVGVGERKFNPNATVSTVEAATMLLKALGYFIEEDQLGADWKTVVTGRATSLKLYGALTLGVDEGLTRDNVAELLFHTLFAQRVAYDDNRHLYVKNTDRDVVVTNGTADKNNTFAMNTFGMWYVDGIVIANSFTNDGLSETTNNKPRTEVLFDAPTDVGTGPVAQYAFEYTTGLDMIGHAARTYYSVEKRAPVVYAIADRATKTGYISYDSNTTRLADAANEAGFRKNSVLLTDPADYIVNYDWDITCGDLTGAKTVDLTGSATTDPAKTLLLISNSSDFKVDYVIVLDQYLDTVERVVEKNGVTEYDLTSGDGDKQNITLEELAAGDYVVVTDIGKQGDMYNLYKPETVAANITKITGVSDSNATVKAITADGTEYKGSPVYDFGGTRVDSLDNTTNFERIATIGDSTLILDFQGKCIGLGEPEKLTNYAYAAQFGVWHTGGSLNTEYKLTVKLHFIDGTSGVYLVNTADSKSSNTFYGLKMSTINAGTAAANAEGMANMLNTGVASGGTYNPKDTYDDQIKVVGGELKNNGKNGLGIYKVSVRADDTVVMTKLAYDVVNGSTKTPIAVPTKTRLVAAHSTLLNGTNNQNMTSRVFNGTTDRAFYQTNKTVYFYVDGSYAADNLTVGTRVGVANAEGISHNESDKDENTVKETFEQIFVTPAKTVETRDTVEAIMIYGYDLGNNTDLYFYKHGNYHITKNGVDVTGRAATDGLTITYDMYKANGEAFSQSYDNDGKGFDMETAKSTVWNKPTGWYTIGSKDINEKFTSSELDQVRYYPEASKLNADTKNVYILNAVADHDTFVENIYTSVDPEGGIILSTAKVIDTVDCGLDSVSDIARACYANHLVRISYTYKTTGGDAYKVDTVFITAYDPAEGSKPTTPGIGEANNPAVAVIDEVTSTVRVDFVDGTGSQTALAKAVSAAGYNFLTTPATITADQSFMVVRSDGTGMRSFVIAKGDDWYSVKVDGTPVEYVKKGENSTKIVVANVDGIKGTGFQVNSPATYFDGTNAEGVTMNNSTINPVKNGDAAASVQFANASVAMTITTTYVYASGAGVTTEGYVSNTTDLSLTNLTSGNAYAYTINGVTKTFIASSTSHTIDKAELVGDVTIEERGAAADIITVINGTETKVFDSNVDAAAYIAGIKDTAKGTGLKKTVSGPTVSYVKYEDAIASAIADGDTFETGYVGVSVDGADKEPVEVNGTFTTTGSSNSATGFVVNDTFYPYVSSEVSYKVGSTDVDITTECVALKDGKTVIGYLAGSGAQQIELAKYNLSGIYQISVDGGTTFNGNTAGVTVVTVTTSNRDVVLKAAAPAKATDISTIPGADGEKVLPETGILSGAKTALLKLKYFADMTEQAKKEIAPATNMVFPFKNGGNESTTLTIYSAAGLKMYEETATTDANSAAKAFYINMQPNKDVTGPNNDGNGWTNASGTGSLKETQLPTGTYYFEIVADNKTVNSGTFQWTYAEFDYSTVTP